MSDNVYPFSVLFSPRERGDFRPWFGVCILTIANCYHMC